LESLAKEYVGLFYGHLVHFTVVCYILWTIRIVLGSFVYFSPFGILYQEKSGNPGLLWVGFLITKVAHIFGLHVSMLRFYINFDTKWWATFWAIFSLSHLVTLFPSQLESGILKTMRKELGDRPECQRTTG
jgi:hypothetical protein